MSTRTFGKNARKPNPEAATKGWVDARDIQQK